MPARLTVFPTHSIKEIDIPSPIPDVRPRFDHNFERRLLMGRWKIVLFVTALSVGGARTARAQETVAAIVAGADQLKSALNDVIGSAGAEGRSVVLQATGALDGAVQQLKQLVNNDLNRQVANLTGAAQALAQRIKNTTKELDDLIRIRMACGVSGVEYLLAGVKTIVGGLQNSVPLIKNQAAFLYAFQFDGHSPGVIPRGGGRATVRGFGLWSGPLAPSLRLMTPTRQSIHQMEVQRGADDNVISTWFWEDLLHSEAGKCDQLEVTTYEKKLLRSPKPKSTLYLPICFPATLNASFKVTAHANFQCRTKGPKTKLDEETFHCANSSCEQRTGCFFEKTWSVGSDCDVLELSQRRGDLNKGSTSVTVSNQGPKVTVNGSLDTADCVNAAFVHHLNHVTEWQMIVAPVVQCSKNAWSGQLDATSNPLPVTADTLPTCVDVPRPCDPIASTAALEASISYGGGAYSSLMTTPTVTVNGNNQQDTQNINYQGMTLEGHFNPIAGEKAQACATLRVPQCGY